jgi:type III effector protein AvrRpm1
VQTAYQESRLYHGTSTAGKASIRQHGFDLDRKAGGATETVAGVVPQDFVDAARGHNYLTGNYDLAQAYAATGRGTPALVRTVLDHGAAGLHDDPDSMPEDRALRTSQNIPAGNILQSKTHGNHALSDAANQHFRQELGNQGLNVTEAQARELPADVQSDSDDDDFTHAKGMGVA